jgi:hypothetical protein
MHNKALPITLSAFATCMGLVALCGLAWSEAEVETHALRRGARALQIQGYFGETRGVSLSAKAHLSDTRAVRAGVQLSAGVANSNFSLRTVEGDSVQTSSGSDGEDLSINFTLAADHLW